VKLNNRTHEPSFQPLDDPRARLPAKALCRGDGLSRDRKARIVDMLEELRNLPEISMVLFEDAIDAIIKEVER
jgi:hypothetical protein